MRSELLEIFVKYVVPPLATLIATGAAWCLGQLASLLTTRAKATKTSVGLAQLAYLAEIVVADIEAHERETLKASSADGSISKEEGARLLAIAKERVISLAKERGFDEAQKLLELMAPAVANLLSGIIERAVAGLPQSAPAHGPALVTVTQPGLTGTPSASATPRPF